MKPGFVSTLLAVAVLGAALPTLAQPARQDVIWARSTAGQHLTLDGKLDEPAWAKAESTTIVWKTDSGIPGSGYKVEAGVTTVYDPLKATLKFLVDGNKLYLGAVVRDSSVGGAADFNRNDGLLMMMMDHSTPDRPTPAFEYFYTWWRGQGAPPDSFWVGQPPIFRGVWAPLPDPVTGIIFEARTPTQIANWNAVTVVHGLSNSDAVIDTDYTVEMVFNLTPLGYDVTKTHGDVIEWSISIYDCDWLWPINLTKFGSNRTWWQNPWGNTSWYSEVKIHARPSVTIDTGPVPVVRPDLLIPNVVGLSPPKIDGQLDDAVWQVAPRFDIRFGDAVLRDKYPGVGKYRSGQYQPEVNGGLAAVLDPADATVRYCFKEDTLYLGFDVRDQAVQYHSIFDRWDGFIVSINEYSERGTGDHQLIGRRLAFQVGPDGHELPQDYLPYMRDTLFGARIALRLKGNTTVDTAAAAPDSGYRAELAVDLTKLGYPHGLGDHRLFLGIDLLDGDSFASGPLDSYGTRTWWFREYEGTNGPCWAYLDKNLEVTGFEDPPPRAISTELALRGVSPNPFRDNTAVRFALARAGQVGLEVFDLQGRLVASQALGSRGPGEQHFVFNRGEMKHGLYLYRLRLTDAGSGALVAQRSGKMMVVR